MRAGIPPEAIATILVANPARVLAIDLDQEALGTIARDARITAGR